MRQRRPPVRGGVAARNAGPSRKPGSQQVEVVPRRGLIGHLDPRNQHLPTGQGSWPVNGHVVDIAAVDLVPLGLAAAHVTLPSTPRSLRFDALFPEPACQPGFQHRHRLSQRLRGVVLEVQPAVADRTRHEADALLVPDLDVPVAPDILGDRREHRLDLRLFGGRPEHPGPLPVPQSPKMSLDRLLDARQLPLDGYLDTEFGEYRKQLTPLVVPSHSYSFGTASVPVERPTHGMSQERGEVVDRGPAVNRHVGWKRPTFLGDDHPQVMRLALHDRFGQRLEVGLPGFVAGGERFQATLHEGHTLAELELLLFGHGLSPSLDRLERPLLVLLVILRRALADTLGHLGELASGSLLLDGFDIR